MIGDASCRRTAACASAYLDGVLEPAARREFQDHCRRCPGCLAELRSLVALRRRVGAVPRRIAPTGLADRVRAEAGRRRVADLAGLEEAPPAHRAWRRAAVAAAALVALALAFGAGRSTAPPPAPAARAPQPTGTLPEHATAPRPRLRLVAPQDWPRPEEPPLPSKGPEPAASPAHDDPAPLEPFDPLGRPIRIEAADQRATDPARSSVRVEIRTGAWSSRER